MEASECASKRARARVRESKGERGGEWCAWGESREEQEDEEEEKEMELPLQGTSGE